MANRKGAPWFPQVSKADALIFGFAILAAPLGALFINWRARKAFEKIGDYPLPPDDQGEEDEF